MAGFFSADEENFGSEEEADEEENSSKDFYYATYSVSSYWEDFFLMGLFFFTTVPPFLWIFSSFLAVLLQMTSDFPTIITSAVLGLMTLLGFFNFYPLVKRAHSFGTFALIFGVGTIICIILSAALFYPNPASPYSAYISQMDQNNNSQIKARGLFNLQNFIENNLGVSKANCDINYPSADCSYPAVSPLNVPPISYNISQMNSTIFLRFNSSGAMIQKIQVQSSQLIELIRIDNHTINSNVSAYTFTYFFPDDNPWKLEIKGLPTSNISVVVNSYFDSLKFSPAIAYYISKLPDWATFVGTGFGLSSVQTQITMPLLVSTSNILT